MGKVTLRMETAAGFPQEPSEQPTWGGGAEAALCPLAHVEVDFGSGNSEQRKGPSGL